MSSRGLLAGSFGVCARAFGACGGEAATTSVGRQRVRHGAGAGSPRRRARRRGRRSNPPTGGRGRPSGGTDADRRRRRAASSGGGAGTSGDGRRRRRLAPTAPTGCEDADGEDRHSAPRTPTASSRSRPRSTCGGRTTATPPLVDPGRGTITIYLKGKLTDVCPDGSDGLGEMTACGTELPPFVSYVNCDAYQITFPDALWDKPTMPYVHDHRHRPPASPRRRADHCDRDRSGRHRLMTENAAWPTPDQTGTSPCAAGTGRGVLPGRRR